MDFKTIDWNKDYSLFLEYLYSFKDDKYASFQQKLINNSECKIIGIRMPILKKLVKQISSGDYLSFIKYNSHQTYEEIVLHGLVVTSLKINFDDSIKLFDKYINYINCWANCDTIVSSYKLFKGNLDIGFAKIEEYLNSSNFWIVRVGLVLLLAYYINDKYIDRILEIANSVNTNEYYVKMANAWLISFCVIKYYDKTYSFLKNNNLDDFTHNKAIQKAIESYQVINKDSLRKLKRK